MLDPTFIFMNFRFHDIHDYDYCQPSVFMTMNTVKSQYSSHIHDYWPYSWPALIRSLLAQIQLTVGSCQ